jgi:(p)ppGpp synthase/HD superfamily hydrolase
VAYKPYEQAKIDLAQRLARKAHDGQFDKAGRPYIEHPARVATAVEAAGYGYQVVCAAWLHDVIEDTEWTAEALFNAGMPLNTVHAVIDLTRVPHQAPEDYYLQVKHSPIALAVKEFDIADNCDPERRALLDPKTSARLERKYAKARRLLGLENA